MRGGLKGFTPEELEPRTSDGELVADLLASAGVQFDSGSHRSHGSSSTRSASFGAGPVAGMAPLHPVTKRHFFSIHLHVSHNLDARAAGQLSGSPCMELTWIVAEAVFDSTSDRPAGSCVQPLSAALRACACRRGCLSLSIPASCRMCPPLRALKLTSTLPRASSVTCISSLRCAGAGAGVSPAAGGPDTRQVPASISSEEASSAPREQQGR